MPSCTECARPVAAPKPLKINGVTFTPAAVRYCDVHGSFALAVACELARSGPPSAAGVTHIRAALGLGGKELASRLGVKAPTISKWEHGYPVDAFAWLVLGSLVLDFAGVAASTASRLDALASAERRKTVPLEDVKQPARAVVAGENERRRQIVEAVRLVYDRIVIDHRSAKRTEARWDQIERRLETAHRRAVKVGKPITAPKTEPHWTDEMEAAEDHALSEYERLLPTMSAEQRAEFQPEIDKIKARRNTIEVTSETMTLIQALDEIDERFGDPEMIERVLYTGRKDAKGAPKTAARIAWEARVEDPDRPDSVEWHDVEAKIAGRYYRALQGA